MELWDLYDKDRRPLGIIHKRGDRLKRGTYHLAVGIWTVNSNNELLITLRDKAKKEWPSLWENTAGSVLKGETSLQGAVRELFEETGISRDDITLKHLMDFTYYNQGCYVEVWCGRLTREVTVIDEANPLCWLDFDHDFFSMDEFAGEGNIGHMLEQIKQFGEGFLD